jgi:deoxyribonuclease-4
MANFGVAGFPLKFAKSQEGKNRERIFPWLASLGLNALELQMTYGPRMKAETCAVYKDLAATYGIKLSVHGSYFIVLTSSDKLKIGSSIDTLQRTFDLAEHLGSEIVVLHPGSLYGQDPKAALDRFLINCSSFFEKRGEGNVSLYVETAGKVGQLGSVEEILHISDVIPGCYPCIDFGHVHARTLGTLDRPEKIDELFDHLKNRDVFSENEKIHFHYTPIDYGPRGEIKHKALCDLYPVSDQGEFSLFRETRKLYHPRPEPVAHNLKKYANPNVTVISETYNSQEEGALTLKKFFDL